MENEKVHIVHRGITPEVIIGKQPASSSGNITNEANNYEIIMTILVGVGLPDHHWQAEAGDMSLGMYNYWQWFTMPH